MIPWQLPLVIGIIKYIICHLNVEQNPKALRMKYSSYIKPTTSMPFESFT